MDGKTARRSHDRKKALGALHSVSVWASEFGLSLGQVACDDKSNEITAIPELLRLVDIRGAIVTIDAMGTQKAIAAQIVDQKADYVLALKGNQETLHDAVIDYLMNQFDNDFAGLDARQHTTTETGHGRDETRCYFQMPVPADLPHRDQWKGLNSIGLVISACVRDGQETIEKRYYISSLPVGVKRFAHAVRSHWGIENSCHWCLDLTFREDESRIRDRNIRENFAWLNRFLLSLLKQNPSKNSSTDNDTYVVSGNATIYDDGGTDTLTVNLPTAASVNLTESAVSFSGYTINYNDIQAINLDGSGGSYTIAPVSQSVSLPNSIAINDSTMTSLSITLTGANDIVGAYGGIIYLVGDVENTSVLYDQSPTATVSVNGGDGNDIMEGLDNTYTDTLLGGNGNDLFYIYGGNHILVGGADNDAYLFNDYYAGTNPLGHDTIVEDVGGGTSDEVDFYYLNEGVTVDLSQTAEQMVVPNHLWLTIQNSTGGPATSKCLPAAITTTRSPEMRWTIPFGVIPVTTR